MGDWDGGTGQEGLAVVGDAQLVLSASSIATFLRCGLQWEFAYVKKVRHPPSLKQGLGLASHSAYESDMLVKLTTGANAEEDVVLDVFNEEFIEYNRQGFLRLKDDEDDEDDPVKAKDQQIRVIQKQHREIAPLIVPVLVEEPFLLKVNGIHYGGTLDLFDAESKLRDWKNTAKKPSRDGGYTLGMIGYAVGYRHLTGLIEREVQIDFLVRYKKQDPGYFPVSSGGPISDEAISGWASTVERVYNAIMAGNFVANGLQNNACSWCGFRSICPAVRR